MPADPCPRLAAAQFDGPAVLLDLEWPYSNWGLEAGEAIDLCLAEGVI